MTISSKLAQNIVQSIKEIIHHEINFMNMEGVIIASTDPVRIGQQHEGALKVLKTKRVPKVLTKSNCCLCIAHNLGSSCLIKSCLIKLNANYCLNAK